MRISSKNSGIRATTNDNFILNLNGKQIYIRYKNLVFIKISPAPGNKHENSLNKTFCFISPSDSVNFTIFQTRRKLSASTANTELDLGRSESLDRGGSPFGGPFTLNNLPCLILNKHIIFVCFSL